MHILTLWVFLGGLLTVIITSVSVFFLKNLVNKYPDIIFNTACIAGGPIIWILLFIANRTKSID